MANELDVTSNNTSLATGKPVFSLKSLNLTQKCPSITVAQTGAKLSRYPFPKIKFEEGRRCRVSILTDEVIMLRLHYHPEVGSIICDGGACCKYCDRVSVRYCYPVVVYETDNSGRAVSTRVELKLLTLGGEMYDQISLLSELGGSITDMDLLFTCTDGKYQRCTCTNAGPALWKNSDTTVQYVTEYMTSNGDKLLEALGKTYTDDEFAVKLGEPGEFIQDQKVISSTDLSDVFSM